MVQTIATRHKSNTSARKSKSKLIAKQCPYCLRNYRDAGKKTYCSKYCTEQACRRRKEALVEAFATLMVKESIYVTEQLYGVPFQISFDHAFREAGQCVQSKHKAVKLKFEQLGFVYNEREKQWLLQPRLVG